jgi:hypothetical protein
MKPPTVDALYCYCGSPENEFCRYNEDLRYSLRSLAKNVPWVRKVHLVVPDDFVPPVWMDARRVSVHPQSSIVPRRFLPTFNSNVIESFVWKVKGLAEHFLYLNDDMYVLRPTPWTAFFASESPHNPINRHEPGAPDHRIVADHPIPYIAMWVNAIQKFGLHNTRIAHNVQPYRKSQVQSVFRKLSKEVLRAASNTFRSGAADVNALRFTTAVTTTTKENTSVRTPPSVDWFVEGDQIQRIRDLPKRKPLPRFACINNSRHTDSHIYDTLRELFPKASRFEIRTAQSTVRRAM